MEFPPRSVSCCVRGGCCEQRLRAPALLCRALQPDLTPPKLAQATQKCIPATLYDWVPSRTHDPPTPARRHALPALPRVLRAPRHDQGRRRTAGERPAGRRQHDPGGGRRGGRAGGGVLLRPGRRGLPDGALPRLPRPPPGDAGRPRTPMGARARLLPRARLARARARRPGGRRRAGSARPHRGGGRRPGADPHGRPRPVPVRHGEGDGAAARRPREEGPTADRPGRGRAPLRDPTGAGAGLHRAAWRPVGRAPRREGHRREARRGDPAPQRLARRRARGGGPRRRPRARPGSAPRVPRHRDAAAGGREAPGGRRARPRGRGGGGEEARDEAAGGEAGEGGGRGGA